MNCQDFEIIVRYLARAQAHNQRPDSGPSPNEVLPATSHGDDCEVCSLRLQDESELSRGLEALATETSRHAPSRHIEEKLLQSYRESFSSIRSGQSKSLATSEYSMSRGMYWLAAAAVVVVVFGVALLRSGSTPRQSVPLSADNGGANPISTPVGATPQAIATLKKNDRVERAPSQRRQHRWTPRSRPDDASLKAAQPAVVNRPDVQSETAQRETEIATQFIALSVLRPASLQDGGQIVRIELSRSAMARFGLPVNMDRFAERVKADVLVSADGFAQAIRFVQ